jgi:hypothetical protein
MILKNITEKAKTVWSSGWQALAGRRSYFISCYRMVRSFIDCLSAAFFQKRFSRSEVPDMSIDSVTTVELF